MVQANTMRPPNQRIGCAGAEHWYRWRFCRQYFAISLVALCSQSLSDASRIISTAANHFGALGAGSPGVFCYNFDGKELWKTDLGKVRNEWGYGSSPILHRGKVILNFGPGDRAFLACAWPEDRQTALEIRRTRRSEHRPQGEHRFVEHAHCRQGRGQGSDPLQHAHPGGRLRSEDRRLLVVL